VPNSCIELATPTTATTLQANTGYKLHSEYSISTVNQQNIEMSPFFALGSTIAGVSDVLYLAVQQTAASPETYYGGMCVRQIT
jgi:hypothetical protein